MGGTPQLGKGIGFHADNGCLCADPCCGDCSYCAEGQYRFEDEQTGEQPLELPRFWRNCADASETLRISWASTSTRGCSRR